ncbi:hypothetical protein L226DRAFT_267260 [Lentinus tigrinus ALCF2SS1-7]|uniref:Uncharacterized protein n=1 Tax=Lentinus tigrinus ALCF2SS1-6 TaxID=1328759 RepID=A0A5C2RWA4_9APHY|nr:hypothetical protein L227DRAFT_332549 [Lentinus tigrinus ALCF2SS1-6]RPD69709.1 hypothetical protein L226DRAFT_267260 [Lentinus tigrinus ALCF2SS1-7]
MVRASTSQRFPEAVTRKVQKIIRQRNYRSSPLRKQLTWSDESQQETKRSQRAGASLQRQATLKTEDSVNTPAAATSFKGPRALSRQGTILRAPTPAQVQPRVGNEEQPKSSGRPSPTLLLCQLFLPALASDPPLPFDPTSTFVRLERPPTPPPATMFFPAEASYLGRAIKPRVVSAHARFAGDRRLAKVKSSMSRALSNKPRKKTTLSDKLVRRWKLRNGLLLPTSSKTNSAQSQEVKK